VGGRIVVVGVLMMTAYLAVLGAMARAPVSYVVAARETHLLQIESGAKRLAGAGQDDRAHVRRRGELAEGRPDEIELTQGERAPDLRSLLSLETRVDGQLALALERDAFAVQPPGEDHPAQQLSELLGR